MVRVFSVDFISHLVIKVILRTSTKRSGVRCHASLIIAQRGTDEQN